MFEKKIMEASLRKSIVISGGIYTHRRLMISAAQTQGNR